VSKSFSTFATTTASTTRSPTVSGSARGARSAYLEDLSIVPPMPASSQTLEHSSLRGTAMELWETFVQSQAHTKSSTPVTELPDIREGDYLIVGSTEYGVVFAGDWPATTRLGTFRMLLLEEHKPQ
jgi:hypothetical protein